MKLSPSLALLALLGVAPLAALPPALAADAVHKAKNLSYASVGQSVFLADPAALKDAKIGDKLKLVDASNPKVTGEGTIATAVVKQENGVKTWVGWTVKVDAIKK